MVQVAMVQAAAVVTAVQLEVVAVAQRKVGLVASPFRFYVSILFGTQYAAICVSKSC